MKLNINGKSNRKLTENQVQSTRKFSENVMGNLLKNVGKNDWN